MLFMTVYTYSPKNRNEVIKRRLANVEPQLSDTVKVVGEWSYIGSGKVFRLVEASDAVEVFKAAYTWSDLGTIETYPVIEVEQLMGMIAAMSK